jgi:hypothetical protein
LPVEFEAILQRAVRRGDAPRFLRRLVNYLILLGDRARIHQDRLLLLALASEDAVRLVRSTSYGLTDRVLEACGLGDRLTAD